MSGKKRTCLSLETKAAIIHEVNKKTRSKTDICREYGIANSSLSTILKNESAIMAAVSSNKFMPDRKKQRTTKQEDLDEALHAWFIQARTLNVPLSGPILMEKGDEIAKTLGYSDFKMSAGWLGRFKARRGIVMKTVCGEAAAVSAQVVNDWKVKDLQDILKNFSPRDIYNADETGLFFKCVPNKTLALKGEVCTGGKIAKDRLTLLIAANMDGSDKLPLLAIGKFERPRCFKNVQTLPVTYKHNKKAWMVSSIFTDWVLQLDRRFLREGRKVALLVDNCTAHPDIDNLKAITLVKLPPNTTSVLQPCDQGIIQAFKKLYRKFVLRRLIAHIDAGNKLDEFQVNVLNALHLSRSAWKEVTSTTISNCFRHAGFVANAESNSQEVVVEQSPSPAEDSEVGNLFSRLQDLIPLEATVEAFINVDENVRTTEELTTQDIVDSLQSSSYASAYQSDEEDQESEFVPPTTKQATQAIQTLKNFLMAQDSSSLTFIDSMNDLEKYVSNVAMNTKKQMQISDFFKKCN